MTGSAQPAALDGGEVLAHTVDLADRGARAQQRAGDRLLVGEREPRRRQGQQRRGAAGDETERENRPRPGTAPQQGCAPPPRARPRPAPGAPPPPRRSSASARRGRNGSRPGPRGERPSALPPPAPWWRPPCRRPRPRCGRRAARAGAATGNAPAARWQGLRPAAGAAARSGLRSCLNMPEPPAGVIHAGPASARCLRERGQRPASAPVPFTTLFPQWVWVVIDGPSQGSDSSIDARPSASPERAARRGGRWADAAW